jgi:hypothetical protein
MYTRHHLHHLGTAAGDPDAHKLVFAGISKESQVWSACYGRTCGERT